MTRTGGCSCGAIRYELDGEPLFTHACHCTDCQRASGGAFVITMIVDATDLRVTAGTPKSSCRIGTSGKEKQQLFCGDCGSWLFGRTAQRPGLMVIRPGTLDDTSRVKPEAHIWTRSKQPWVPLPDGVPAFDTVYDAAALWPEASLRRATDARTRAVKNEIS